MLNFVCPKCKNYKKGTDGQKLEIGSPIGSYTTIILYCKHCADKLIATDGEMIHIVKVDQYDR